MLLTLSVTSRPLGDYREARSPTTAFRLYATSNSDAITASCGCRSDSKTNRDSALIVNVAWRPRHFGSSRGSQAPLQLWRELRVSA
jgi:hypothetical protein